MNRALTTFSRNCNGNLSVIAALAVIPVALAGGVAIDFGRGTTAAASFQEALDAAVLAGVAEKYDNVAAAKATFTREVSDKNTQVSNVSFVKSGSVTITGTLTATVPTSFSRLFGLNALTFHLTSVAQGGASNSNDLCILTLAPAQSQEFLANGGANVNASTCTVNVRSTANPAAVFNAGTTINSKKLCIQGSQIIDNGGSHPNLQLGCTPPADPYAGKISAPVSTACDYQNMNYSGTVTLSPGTYCGWTNFNSGTNVTLNAGTYIIKSGGWNVNGGNWTGTGVTFLLRRHLEDTVQQRGCSHAHRTDIRNLQGHPHGRGAGSRQHAVHL